MTYSLLRLGEPRLKGKVKGGAVVDPCTDPQGTERFTTAHGGVERVDDEVSLPLPLEIPGAYAPDILTGGRVVGVRYGNDSDTAFNKASGLPAPTPWANANFPHGGWIGTHGITSGAGGRTAFENRYNDGGVWKLTTTRAHSGTHSLRHVIGFEESPSSPPSGTRYYELTALMPMSGLLCDPVSISTSGVIEGMAAYPPYSCWAAESDLITLRFWSFMGYTSGSEGGTYDPFWAIRFIYLGTEYDIVNSDIDLSYYDLNNPPFPEQAVTLGGGWEQFEMSSVCPRTGAVQISLHLHTDNMPNAFDINREWVHVDDLTITKS